jgi:hypothetical protein
MRTTLDIEDDILQAARELARSRGTTAGKVLSELARRGLGRPAARRVRNGVPLLSPRPDGKKITMDLVNRLRDEE